ncbi:MAG: FKBP-type peptidyl-prolyl cis-trans isomerase [Acidobacteriota bacterium]
MSKARRKKARRKKAAPQSKIDTKVAVVIIIGVIILTGGIYALTRGTGSNQTTVSQPVIDETGAITTPSGLKYIDLVEGTGPSPQAGQRVTVHYTGTLANGSKFDSSVDKNQPYEFKIGTGVVIKGWDEGVMSMKVGGKRKLIVPPNSDTAAKGDRAFRPTQRSYSKWNCSASSEL